MTASSLFRFVEKPYVLGGVAMLWGWMQSLVQQKPQYPDPEFRRFLRRYQMRALLVGKRRAIEEIDRAAGLLDNK